LVKPSKPEKLTTFITELTGITNEMLADAPSADDAFNQFFDWVISINGNQMPQYFCYGNSDAKFIERTVKYMTDTRAISFAMSIKAMLVDYSSTVKSYLSVKQIALKKVVALIEDADEAIQSHNALEDAEMLRKVVKELQTKCSPADTEKLAAIKSTPKPKNNKYLPDICYHWPSDRKKKYEADTRATEDDYVCKCVDQAGIHIKYFDSVETAAIWLMRYNMTNGHTLRREGDLAKVIKNLVDKTRKGKQPYGFAWEIKEENNETE
jgi:DNA polymerase III epsilon subunit-like protein